MVGSVCIEDRHDTCMVGSELWLQIEDMCMVGSVCIEDRHDTCMVGSELWLQREDMCMVGSWFGLWRRDMKHVWCVVSCVCRGT